MQNKINVLCAQRIKNKSTNTFKNYLNTIQVATLASESALREIPQLLKTQMILSPVLGEATKYKNINSNHIHQEFLTHDTTEIL